MKSGILLWVTEYDLTCLINNPSNSKYIDSKRTDDLKLLLTISDIFMPKRKMKEEDPKKRISKKQILIQTMSNRNLRMGKNVSGSYTLTNWDIRCIFNMSDQ
jgi:hypothetical protein